MEITIISGPTCVGKTSTALDIAQKNNAQIISCDSVQVYKYMNIGSAKASKEEMQGIPHHLIDVCEPSENFDISKYIEHAKKALEKIKSANQNVVIVGGSGFYLKSWFSAVTDNIAVTKETRNYVKTLSNEKLVEELFKLDPDASKFIDIHNPRRVSRALERCIESKLSIKEQLENFKKLPCPYGDLNRKFIMLDCEKEELFNRITARTKAMLKNGLIEECEFLLKKDVLKNPSAALAIGYKECFAAIQSDNVNKETLCEEIIKNTISLVKKQRKFFANPVFSV